MAGATPTARPIFEDSEDEIRYLSDRVDELESSLEASKRESKSLYKAGRQLQRAFEELQETHREAVGDVAYWKALALARSNELEELQGTAAKELAQAPALMESGTQTDPEERQEVTDSTNASSPPAGPRVEPPSPAPSAREALRAAAAEAAEAAAASRNQLQQQQQHQQQHQKDAKVTPPPVWSTCSPLVSPDLAGTNTQNAAANTWRPSPSDGSFASCTSPPSGAAAGGVSGTDEDEETPVRRSLFASSTSLSPSPASSSPPLGADLGNGSAPDRSKSLSSHHEQISGTASEVVESAAQAGEAGGHSSTRLVDRGVGRSRSEPEEQDRRLSTSLSPTDTLIFSRGHGSRRRYRGTGASSVAGSSCCGSPTSSVSTSRMSFATAPDTFGSRGDGHFPLSNSTLSSSRLLSRPSVAKSYVAEFEKDVEKALSPPTFVPTPTRSSRRPRNSHPELLLQRSQKSSPTITPPTKSTSPKTAAVAATVTTTTTTTTRVTAAATATAATGLAAGGGLTGSVGNSSLLGSPKLTGSILRSS